MSLDLKDNVKPRGRVDKEGVFVNLVNVKQRRRVDKEGVFVYISIKDSQPNTCKHVEASIISFPTTWMVESGFLAVVVVFSRKRNKLDFNSRGTIRLRLNNFIKIDYILCQKHKHQVSH